MVQRCAGLQRFPVIPASKNPFKHWEKQSSCTQNHNVCFKWLKIRYLILLLFFRAVFIQVFHDFRREAGCVELPRTKEQPVWVYVIVAYQELNPGRTEATVALGRFVSKGYCVPAVETIPVGYCLETANATISLQSFEGIKEAHGYIHISGHQFFIFHIIHLTFGRHD